MATVLALVTIAWLTLHAGMKERHTPRFTEATGIEVDHDPAKYSWTAFSTFGEREWGQTCLGGLGWALLAGLAANSLRQRSE